MEPHEWHSAELDRILKNEEEREENRHRKECREATRQARERTYSSICIDLHDRFALLYRILVLLLRSCELRLKLLHLQARAHCALVERPECETHQNSQNDQHPA